MLAEHWLRKVLATDLLDPQLGPPAANVEKFRSPHQSEGSWAGFLESGLSTRGGKSGGYGWEWSISEFRTSTKGGWQGSRLRDEQRVP